MVLERERERERERESMVFANDSFVLALQTILLFWLGFLEYRKTMFGSVNQS